jgi:hypothetical protein
LVLATQAGSEIYSKILNSKLLEQKQGTEMVQILPRSSGNILGIRCTGMLTEADYEGILIPELIHIIKNFNKARFLFLMDSDFHGWDTLAFLDYIRFGIDHKDDFEKVAAIGGPLWLEQWMRFKDYFINADVRTFALDELDDAWEWISW